MLSIWVIALFVIVFMRDALPGASGPSGLGSGGGAGVVGEASSGGLSGLLAPGSVWVWGLGLLPYVVIALIVHGVLLAAAREIDRSGSRRALLLADRTVAMSRVLVVAVHFGNVMLLGWLTSARAVVGDVILLDELICIVPPILVFVAGWFSAYAIDRRLREAAMFRTVESGRTVYAPPTRGQFVVSNARNMLALPLAPLVFLAAWGELGDRALQRLTTMKYDPGLLGRISRWMSAGEGNAEYAKILLQLIGVALVMALAPLAVRVLWDTVRMSSGVMRDRLLSMCKASRVRVNEILVWRTHGTMTNGAVVGLTGRLRYVLLTDALLDAMPTRQVEAVMAHEIAHARHAHIPWLAVVFLSAFGCIAALAGGAWQWALDLAGVQMNMESAEHSFRVAGPDAGAAGSHDTLTLMYVLAGDAMVTVGSLVGGVLVLGFVSRRFEWQADAFAAKSLSTLGPMVGQSATSTSTEHAATQQADAAREYSESGRDVPTVSIRPQAASAGHPGAAKLDEQPVPLPHDALRARVVAVHEEPEVNDGLVRRAAVDAMAEALQTVAALNAIPRHRASFRHGSIAQRQRKLRELVGLSQDVLPIDRTVRWIKRLAAAGLMMILVLMVLD